MFAWRRLPSEVSKAPTLIKFVHFSLHSFDILLNVDSLSNIQRNVVTLRFQLEGLSVIGRIKISAVVMSRTSVISSILIDSIPREMSA